MPTDLPQRVPWLVRGFLWYVRRLVRRSTHAVRVLDGHAPPAIETDTPVIVCMNHPSWWDPMVASVLADTHLRRRRHYAPIDAAMLEQYGVFKRLGFYGVERGTRRGAAAFLRQTETILDSHTPGGPVAVWVTAQGDFTDVRARPVKLAAGLAHVVARAAKAGRPAVVLPLAVEYAWWEQRTPEVLVAYGERLSVAAGSGPGLTSGALAGGVAALNEELERRLTAAMDALAAAAIGRDPTRFAVVLGGKAGVGGAYDGARRLKAWVTGRRFDPRHGVG